MISIAETALADVKVEDNESFFFFFSKFAKREKKI